MTKATVFLQDACYTHQYIRTKDTSLIVERPERIRAVKVGVAAALSLEHILDDNKPASDSSPDDLVNALERLDIASTTATVTTVSTEFNVVRSAAYVDLLTHPAVKFVHGDVDGDVHVPRITKLAKESFDKISAGDSEIPLDLGWKQGDLYLCPESIQAMEGAVGTICEAVDSVLSSQDNPTRAFVVVRPPGHHCGEDTPEGFCFVNNVAIAAAHAHLKHGIKKVVIFDIDLHHGNGTQSIVWQMNEETYRQTLESEGGSQNVKPGPRVYYGSVHDVLSYPCEDGDLALVQAASVSIHGAHGQYIENVHLEEYDDEEHFHSKLYAKYALLLAKAEKFLESDGDREGCIFFISCGMDACEHEYPSMSRHNRKVPVSFYHRFTKDVVSLADKWAGSAGKGKVVSVLEGGYSDRALISGTMAHVLGLAEVGSLPSLKDWWAIEKLERLEKATKATKRRGGKQSIVPIVDAATERWIERTTAAFAAIDEGFTRWTPPTGLSDPVGTTMRLRERPSRRASPTTSPQKPESNGTKKANGKLAGKKEDSNGPDSAPVKLPKVILKLGPKPEDD